FPVKPQAFDRAAARYRRYGRWSLLLSWVPIIGDPLTVVAGVLREPLWSFVAIVTIAKAGRYLVLAGAVLN
ncbi:DedA family protein, partial [Mesorhizobium sp. M7A.F.Ca.US.001.04.1.1]